MSEDNILRDLRIETEDLIGPPKIDMVGIGMMLLVAIVVGFLSSIGIVIFIFLSLGTFSFGNGVSPILLAMITFFALTVSNVLYLWSSKGIFPHIYTGSRTTFMHVSVFSIILYIAIAPLYLIVDSQIIDGSGILIGYITHILLNMFGLEIVMSVLSNYRYSLLSIYASITSFIITGSFLFFIYEKTNTESNNTLFVLLALSMIAFTTNTLVNFLIRYFYYKFYTMSGTDPIGDVFARVEQEAKDLELEVEKELLKKI